MLELLEIKRKPITAELGILVVGTFPTWRSAEDERDRRQAESLAAGHTLKEVRYCVRHIDGVQPVIEHGKGQPVRRKR